MNRRENVIAEGWITTNEAASLTGYTVHYLRRLARENRLEACKIGREWLFRREAVKDWRAEMDRLDTRKHSPKRNPQWIESKRGGGD